MWKFDVTSSLQVLPLGGEFNTAIDDVNCLIQDVYSGDFIMMGDLFQDGNPLRTDGVEGFWRVLNKTTPDDFEYRLLTAPFPDAGNDPGLPLLGAGLPTDLEWTLGTNGLENFGTGGPSGGQTAVGNYSWRTFPNNGANTIPPNSPAPCVGCTFGFQLQSDVPWPGFGAILLAGGTFPGTGTLVHGNWGTIHIDISQIFSKSYLILPGLNTSSPTTYDDVLSIPNDPALSGFDVYMQGAIVENDPPGPSFFLTNSPAMHLKISN